MVVLWLRINLFCHDTTVTLSVSYFRTILKLARFGHAKGEYAEPIEDIVAMYDAKEQEIRIEYDDGKAVSIYKE